MTTDTAVKVDRQLVRAFVTAKARQLESAAANNELPLYKLDLRDEFEAAHAGVSPDQMGRLMLVFDQEMEALCQQLRIGGAIVASQVERVKPKPSIAGRVVAAIVCGLLFFIVGAMIGSNGNTSGGGAALLIIGLPIAGAFIGWAITGKSKSDRPE